MCIQKRRRRSKVNMRLCIWGVTLYWSWGMLRYWQIYLYAWRIRQEYLHCTLVRLVRWLWLIGLISIVCWLFVRSLRIWIRVCNWWYRIWWRLLWYSILVWLFGYVAVIMCFIRVLIIRYLRTLIWSYLGRRMHLWHRVRRIILVGLWVGLWGHIIISLSFCLLFSLFLIFSLLSYWNHWWNVVTLLPAVA